MKPYLGRVAPPPTPPQRMYMHETEIFTENLQSV